jgi:hypothetical protein
MLAALLTFGAAAISVFAEEDLPIETLTEDGLYVDEDGFFDGFVQWEYMEDTDEDGLPDDVEYLYACDWEDPDTDKDGLPDGYEVSYTRTDPAIYDTDEKGQSDSEKDMDNDGLKNAEEMKYGTKPYDYDTDWDDLSDFTEIHIYNTDPLKYDTDGDFIGDGDEIKMRLNPKKVYTYDVPDNKYHFKAKFGENDERFSFANTDESLFALSAEFEAAGYAENSFWTYREFFINAPYITGEAVNFRYDENLTVKNITVKYRLKSDRKDAPAPPDEYNYLRQFRIYKHSNKAQISLPLKTYVDDETKTIYAYSDEIGAIFLVDISVLPNNSLNSKQEHIFEEIYMVYDMFYQLEIIYPRYFL